MDRIRTAMVGSYAQPNWLIDRNALRSRLPPRVPVNDMWRVDSQFLTEAMDDAVLSALRDQEEADLDIVTDGEIRRESYSAPFANALEGIDPARTGTLVGRAGRPNSVPLITGPLKRTRPVHVDDVRFIRAHTNRTLKVTVPGPFTLSQLAVSEYYETPEQVAIAYAECLNEEIKDLFAAGADVVQLDDPYLQARVDDAEIYGITAVNRAVDAVDGITCLHICFGYAAIMSGKKDGGYSCLALVDRMNIDHVSIEAAQPSLDLNAVLPALGTKTITFGVLDLSDQAPETPEIVAKRLRSALKIVPARRLIAAPDCGMKYLPRECARAKLKALSMGAAIVNSELRG